MKFSIIGKFDSTNKIIGKARGNRFASANHRKDELQAICYQVRAQMMGNYQQSFPLQRRVSIAFDWYCSSKRTDPDNIRGASKTLIDALVTCGVLEGDRWKNIASFTDNFHTATDGVDRVDMCINEIPQ